MTTIVGCSMVKLAAAAQTLMEPVSGDVRTAMSELNICKDHVRGSIISKPESALLRSSLAPQQKDASFCPRRHQPLLSSRAIVWLRRSIWLCTSRSSFPSQKFAYSRRHRSKCCCSLQPGILLRMEPKRSFLRPQKIRCTPAPPHTHQRSRARRHG